MGHYALSWDGDHNAKISIQNGFECYGKELEGSIVNYENLDNAQMRIHDYFKYLKYGYDRVTDWCCWHIRRGRLTKGRGNNNLITKFKVENFHHFILVSH